MAKDEEKPESGGKEESEESEERKSPSGRVVYETVLAEADEELSRPSFSLFWSGVAAGLSMGFSSIAPALLKAHLPEADWAPREPRRAAHLSPSQLIHLHSPYGPKPGC